MKELFEALEVSYSKVKNSIEENKNGEEATLNETTWLKRAATMVLSKIEQRVRRSYLIDYLLRDNQIPQEESDIAKFKSAFWLKTEQILA